MHNKEEEEEENHDDVNIKEMEKFKETKFQGENYCLFFSSNIKRLQKERGKAGTGKGFLEDLSWIFFIKANKMFKKVEEKEN